MKSVSAGALSHVIGEIYAAAHDPAHWKAAIAAIRCLLDGSKACIVPFGFEIAPDLCHTDTVLDPSLMPPPDLFVEVRAFEARVRSMPLGAVYEDHALHSSRKPWRETRIWREWMAPQDMYGGLGSRLLETPTGNWFFDVQRGARQAGFDGEAIGVVGLLVPHLRQAIGLSLRSGLGARALESLDCLPFGMMLVDSSLRIHRANEAAERLLDERISPLTRRDGQLAISREAGGMDALRRSLSRACSADRWDPPCASGDIVLHAPHEPGQGLLLSISPLGTTGGENRFVQRMAAIAMRPLRTTGAAQGLESRLRGAFDLSAREAALVVGLASGLSLRETAERSGIAFSTARSYLETVFAKTGTRRQGELIALANGLAPLLRSPQAP